MQLLLKLIALFARVKHWVLMRVSKEYREYWKMVPAVKVLHPDPSARSVSFPLPDGARVSSVTMELHVPLGSLSGSDGDE